MAYTHCLERIRQAAGKQISEAEIAAIFERIHKTALDIKAGRTTAAKGDNFDGVVQQAAREAAAELVRNAELAQRQAQLQITRMSARARDVDTMIAGGLNPLKAVERAIVRDYSGRTNVESLEQRVAGHKAYFGSKVLQAWDALGRDFLGFFQDKAKLVNLVRELRGEDSGDALAKQGAKSFRDTAEEARQVFNQAGGDIGKLDDWGMPQHHSQEKVAAAGRDAWVKDILPRLDRARYTDGAGRPLDDARMQEFLGKAWDTIATNGHANREPGQFSGAGKRANRHAESRQIHFKDADSVIAYWDQFGERTAAEILTSHIDTMARDIAFVEHFGPNPDTTYRTLRDRALRASTVAEPTKTESFEGKAIKMDILYDYAAGRIKPSANSTVSGIADGIAHLNAAGKLGGAALASLFGDKPMMEAVSHMNNLPLLQRWHTEMALLNPANAADRRLMQQQGLMLEGIRSGLNRFYEGLGKTGTTGKLANAVMRITGMNAINEIRKGAFGTSLMSAIGEQIAAGRGFADLDKTDIRALKHYGITKAEWEIWQQAKLQDLGHGNANALTPEAISRIPDADIRAVIPDRLKALNDEAEAQIDNLNTRNQQESGRVANRLSKFQSVKDSASNTVKKFAASKDAKLQNLSKSINIKADLLSAQIEQSQVRADIDAYILAEKSREKIQQFLRDVEDGAEIERGTKLERVHPDNLPDAVIEVTKKSKGLGEKAIDAVDAALLRRGTIGENIGRREGSINRRIVELEAQLRIAEQGANADVRAKAKDAVKKIDDARAELADFVKRSTERQSRRQAVMDRIANDIEPRMQQEVISARREAIVKLLGAVNTESEFAIVTPGWKERAAFYGDLQRGTAKGEIVRSILQFKSFPWTMFHRMADAISNKDTPVSKAAMAAYLVTATTLAGAMLIQTRDMLTGKDPRDSTTPEFWGAAFLQGGALGIYGDFIYGAGHTRYGSGILETVSGPTIGPLLEIALVQPLNAIAKAKEGKETNFVAQELQDLKGFIPGSNIWYTKAATDHLIFQNVFEALSPGYLNSMRRRTQKEFNQDWWWEPGELTPDRAPDLGAAAGG